MRERSGDASGQHAVGGAGDGHRGGNLFAGGGLLHHAPGNGRASAGGGIVGDELPDVDLLVEGGSGRGAGGGAAVVGEAGVQGVGPLQGAALVIIKSLMAVFGTGGPGSGILVDGDHRIGSVVVLLHRAADHTALVPGGKGRNTNAHTQQRCHQNCTDFFKFHKKRLLILTHSPIGLVVGSGLVSSSILLRFP